MRADSVSKSTCMPSIKSPKVYIRDCGLVHALLGLATKEDLLSHPIVADSREGYVIETLLEVAPPGTDASFYRTLAGAEIDLVLTLPGGRTWTVEVKRGVVPKLERGFHEALATLTPDKSFVVYNGLERFPLSDLTEAIGLVDLARELQAVSR
jgi:predicted AAA+ superfamily ATPase